MKTIVIPFWALLKKAGHKTIAVGANDLLSRKRRKEGVMLSIEKSAALINAIRKRKSLRSWNTANPNPVEVETT
jgi:hypothetical protein